ncbi:MAG TPA: glycosyltransferase, partial [Kofleriaceae bacterium]|nr:glycosyltransferase [Kofleriaceae bacterium]
MTRRALFSMTIDPEGAMDDWVDPPPGWSIEPLPTQEAVLVLGIAGYQELVAETCARERPDLLVTHPPYDYLDEATAARVRAAGTAIVGYAFDDEIFAGAYREATWARLRTIYDRYVTTREVRWATRPLAALPPPPAGAPVLDVVLVGSAYERRARLVDALRAAGIAVTTRGPGWPDGFVSRAAMEALYARAAVVLTTGDWADHEVPMVKHRLLDTAMLGAFQLAQASPDLRGYFAEDEVPSYRDAAELVERVRAALADPAGRRAAAARARARALREHTWQVRFGELL